MLSCYFCLVLFGISLWKDLRLNNVYKSFNFIAKVNGLWRMCFVHFAQVMVNIIGLLSILFATPSPILRPSIHYWNLKRFKSCHYTHRKPRCAIAPWYRTCCYLKFKLVILTTCRSNRTVILAIQLLKQWIYWDFDFEEQLISRFGPVSWPPRSCDITPLDFFL